MWMTVTDLLWRTLFFLEQSLHQVWQRCSQVIMNQTVYMTHKIYFLTSESCTYLQCFIYFLFSLTQHILHVQSVQTCFFKPLRETTFGLKNWLIWEIRSKITVFNWKGGKLTVGMSHHEDWEDQKSMAWGFIWVCTLNRMLPSQYQKCTYDLCA